MPAPNRFVTARLTFRQGPTSEWELHDPVLLQSEPAWDTTLSSLKIGDGVSKWSELDYIAKSGFLDSETRGGFTHDGTVIPAEFDSLTSGIVYSAAQLKIMELTAIKNYTAGLQGGVEQFAIILTAGPNGSVSFSGTQTTDQQGTEIFDKDTVVTVTATPNASYVFDKWIGEGVADADSATTTIPMAKSRHLRALFKLPS